MTTAQMELLVLSTWEAMVWRGHDPSGVHGETRISNTLTRLTCDNCGMIADANTHPQANGIDIGGEAVALNCPKSYEGYIYGEDWDGCETVTRLR